MAEILFEVTRYGQMMRVTALDPETLTEVAAVGPVSVGELALRLQARRMLLRRLEGWRQGQDRVPPASDDKGGLLV